MISVINDFPAKLSCSHAKYLIVVWGFKARLLLHLQQKTQMFQELVSDRN